jgi:hypothetical protein
MAMGAEGSRASTIREIRSAMGPGLLEVFYALIGELGVRKVR